MSARASSPCGRGRPKGGRGVRMWRVSNPLPALRADLCHRERRLAPTYNLLRLRWIDPHRLRNVAALIHHERSFKFDDNFAVLIETDRLDPHNADIRPRLRFALLQHLASRV